MTKAILLLGPGNEDPQSADAPACMVSLGNEPILSNVLRSLDKAGCQRFAIVTTSELDQRWKISGVAKKAVPHASVVATPRPTGGAACSALIGLDECDMEDEVVVIGLNELIHTPPELLLERFRQRNCQVGVVGFDATSPLYSYVDSFPGADGRYVSECAEQKLIGQYALATLFWFKKGALLSEAAIAALLMKRDFQGKFYMSGVVNQALLHGLAVGLEVIPSNSYVPLKNERQISYAAMKHELPE